MGQGWTSMKARESYRTTSSADFAQPIHNSNAQSSNIININSGEINEELKAPNEEVKEELVQSNGAKLCHPKAISKNQYDQKAKKGTYLTSIREVKEFLEGETLKVYRLEVGGTSLEVSDVFQREDHKVVLVSNQTGKVGMYYASGSGGGQWRFSPRISEFDKCTVESDPELFKESLCPDVDFQFSNVEYVAAPVKDEFYFPSDYTQTTIVHRDVVNEMIERGIVQGAGDEVLQQPKRFGKEHEIWKLSRGHQFHPADVLSETKPYQYDKYPFGLGENKCIFKGNEVMNMHPGFSYRTPHSFMMTRGKDRLRECRNEFKEGGKLKPFLPEDFKASSVVESYSLNFSDVNLFGVSTKSDANQYGWIEFPAESEQQKWLNVEVEVFAKTMKDGSGTKLHWHIGSVDGDYNQAWIHTVEVVSAPTSFGTVREWVNLGAAAGKAVDYCKQIPGKMGSRGARDYCSLLPFYQLLFTDEEGDEKNGLAKLIEARAKSQ